MSGGLLLHWWNRRCRNRHNLTPFYVHVVLVKVYAVSLARTLGQAWPAGGNYSSGGAEGGKGLGKHGNEIIWENWPNEYV